MNGWTEGRPHNYLRRDVRWSRVVPLDTHPQFSLGSAPLASTLLRLRGSAGRSCGDFVYFGVAVPNTCHGRNARLAVFDEIHHPAEHYSPSLCTFSAVINNYLTYLGACVRACRLFSFRVYISQSLFSLFHCISSSCELQHTCR